MIVRAADVRFDYLNKSFLFDAQSIDATPGDIVVVETDYGLDMGILAEDIAEKEIDQASLPLKKLLRVTTEEDLIKLQELGPREEKAHEVCVEEIEKASLQMKLVNVRYSFDGSRVSFCYTADGRVDFRELVKKLAARLKTRIELRQVGVRDEARLFGGFGPCGRRLCCASFLHEFKSVSIKMAKEQGLPLNPVKISGICSRLFCCLRYEYSEYLAVKRLLPRVGHTIEQDGVKGRVTNINVLKHSVTVYTESGGWAEVKIDIPENDLIKCCQACAAETDEERENNSDFIPDEPPTA